MTSPLPKIAETRGQKRLTYCLIVKTIIELLFVAILAIGFYLTAFHPYFRGWVDDANSRWIRGWVIKGSAPAEDVEAQLYIDGRFVESQPANQLRPDIVALHLVEDEKHGFFFNTPALEEGEHEARVYAVHESGGGERRTLQLIGQPFRFILDANPAEPYFQGWVDEVNVRYIKGWILDKAEPSTIPEVQLFIDKHFIESQRADQPRSDLVAAGIANDEKHGFFFTAPALDAGEHEVRVYVVHEKSAERSRILRLIGTPLRFVVDAADNRAPVQDAMSTPDNSLR